MYVTTAAEMRELDRATIEDIGIPGVVLMESAGRQTAEQILAEPRIRAAARIGVLCGAGNNGGDGYVVARWLASAGHVVRCWLLAPRDRIRGDALTNLLALERLGGDLVEVPDEAALHAERPWLDACDVLVDALLGTGLSSEVRGLYRAAIDATEAFTGLRVAVDIPSGVHADTGQVLGAAFRADLTITYGCWKHGLLHHPGAGHAGRVVVVDIGIPPAVASAHEPRAVLLEPTRLRGLLPARAAAAHKGTYGHVLVLAGSPGKSGAALLAGLAALRGGAGLVTVATDRGTQSRIEGRVPELMVESFRDAPDADGLAGARALAAGKAAVCVGPGLGDSAGTAALVMGLLDGGEAPLVIDADGLNVLAGRLDALRGSRAPVVLTPHPGELGRLLGCSAAAINADRPAAARALSLSHGVTVILKGAHTVVSSPSGRLGVCPTGNPGMASAGTGDVLAGLVTSLLARTGDPEAAAWLAVWLHGAAGDLAAAAGSEPGLTASALSDALPRAFRALDATG